MSESEVIFVEHAGHRIACLVHENESATRLPVVWLHGLTVSVRFWEEAMYRDVAADRSWYSISMPFHYPSTFGGEVDQDALSEDLFAELLAKPIEQLLPAGKFHLVGHSLGGFSALNYTAKFPGRVASVVSIGGFMRGRAKGLEGALQFLSAGTVVRRALFHVGFWILQRHVMFLKMATMTYARAWSCLLSYPELDDTLGTIFPDVKRHSIPAQRALCRYLLEMDLFDEIDQITSPVLIVCGAKDPIIPPEHQIACAEKLEQGRLLLIPEIGHLAFAEAPKTFERKLLQWLDEQG